MFLITPKCLQFKPDPKKHTAKALKEVPNYAICKDCGDLIQGIVSMDRALGLLQLTMEAEGIVRKCAPPSVKPSDFDLLYTVVSVAKGRYWGSQPKIEVEPLL